MFIPLRPPIFIYKMQGENSLNACFVLDFEAGPSGGAALSSYILWQCKKLIHGHVNTSRTLPKINLSHVMSAYL